MQGIRQHIQQNVKSYWAKTKSELLLELDRHAQDLGNLQSGNTKPELGESRSERPNACNHNARNIMNIESASNV